MFYRNKFRIFVPMKQINKLKVMKTIIIKNPELTKKRDHFERNGGRFNLNHFAEVLKAKGKDASEQLQFFSAINLKKA